MKKWATLSLAAVIAAGSLVGCAKKDDTSAPGKTGTTSAAPTKFSISMRTLAFNYVETSPDINADKWVKLLEQKTNADMNIILVPHKDYEQKMIQMFATGDIPDVVQAEPGANGKDLGGAIQAGVFAPLDDLLQKYGQDLLKKVPKAAWDKETYNGKIYGVPEFLGNPSRRATVIRRDLLDKTGLPVPKTVEESLNVLRAFKKLGVADPYQGRQDFKYADTFFGSYDVFPYLTQFMQQGNQVVPKFFNVDGMQKALGTYKTMYDEGLINKEFATINPTQFKNNILAGKAGMWSMNANEMLQWETQMKTTVPEAKLEIITSPTGDDGKGGYYMYSPATRAFLINKNYKKPEEIIKLLNWMVSDEAEKFFTYGVEGENYTVDNGKINYKAPTDTKGVDEERYRQNFLWMIQDTTYNKGTLSLTPEGQKLINTYDTILAKEGRDGIQFDQRLDALVKNPEISPNADTGPNVLLTHMVKMVYGKEPITDWPKALDEWKSKGGNDVIKEATDKFNKKDGVSMPRR